MGKPLSPTMTECLAYIRDGGGEIERFPGGFWATPGEHPWPGHSVRQHYGTTTVQALITRGKLEYTEWKQNQTGRFPIRAMLAARQSQEGDDG